VLKPSAETRSAAAERTARPAGPDAPIRPRSYRRRDLPILGAALLSSLCLTWLILERLSPASSPLAFGLLWFTSFLAMYYLVVRELDGPLAASDRAMAVLAAAAGLFVVVPLLLIVGFTTLKGIVGLTLHFFTETLVATGPLDAAQAGGAAHAVVGTLMQVGLAVLISVPLGVLTAVFLNEVGGPLKRPVRLFVDAMSGVPSIVAGLFVFAIWVVELDQGFSGFAAALALSILMLPIVTRTSEEVLRLVPGGLREASLALGAPEWRTTWHVVLPTARSGLLTAVLLGIARAVGETAPLLVTSLGSKVMNWNAFSGAQESLPHFVWDNVRSPLPAQVDRAWTGALVLILMVLGLFVTARRVGARPLGRKAGRRKGGRRKRPLLRDAAHVVEG
jgi:phosphate transport system permease protein